RPGARRCTPGTPHEALGRARPGGESAPRRRLLSKQDATRERRHAPRCRSRRTRGGTAGVAEERVTMKHLRSALSTAGLAVIATLGVLPPRPVVAQSNTPTFVQGTAFST